MLPCTFETWPYDRLMKKVLLLSMVVVLAGCGESQLDRRAKMEASEEPEEKAGNEELKANEEPVESPKAPQTKRRPGDGKNQARPGQQGRRPGGGFGRRDPYANLGLSEEQQEKIDAIQTARREESRKMFEELRGGGGDREAMMAKFRELTEKYQKQTDALLTDEQKKKMAEERAQRPQGGQNDRGQGGRGQSGRGQGRGNEFAALGVNEGQQKNLDAARQSLSTQMRELFLDSNISREDRAPKIEKIREAYEAKIKEVLTEEQFKKFKEGASSQRGQGQGRRPGQGGARPGGNPQPKKQ